MSADAATLMRQIVAGVLTLILAGSLIWVVNRSIITSDSVIRLEAALPEMITKAVKKGVTNRYTSKDADADKKLNDYRFNSIEQASNDHETRLKVLEKRNP